MNATLTKASIAEPDASTHCQHHWLIDLPNGAKSRGICKRCRAVKRFYNAFSDLPSRERALAPFARRAAAGEWQRR